MGKKALKFYFAFRRLKNFACVEVHPQTKMLLIYLKVDPSTVDLEDGFGKRHRIILYTLLSSGLIVVSSCRTGHPIPWYEYDVSMVRLIANPEHFDRHFIALQGYLISCGYAHDLYISKEFAVADLHENAIGVVVPQNAKVRPYRANVPPNDVVEKLSGHYVRVWGTFRLGDHPESASVGPGFIQVEEMEPCRSKDGDTMESNTAEHGTGCARP